MVPKRFIIEGNIRTIQIQSDHKGRPCNGRAGLYRIIVGATLVVALEHGRLWSENVVTQYEKFFIDWGR
jgi:hypothetical protein